MLRTSTAVIGGVLLWAQAAFPVFAQTWPTRPLRLVVPFSSSNVLVVVPNLPVANLAEFIAYVKSGQHTVNYGSGGHGTSQHLAAALFNNMIAGKMVHVPYKGGAPATIALLGGEIHTIFAPLIEVLPHIRSGFPAPKPIKTLACGR